MEALTDNTTYQSDAINRIFDSDVYPLLRQFANVPMKEFVEKAGSNLLIFPHSFTDCDDGIGEQQLFSLQERWQGNEYTPRLLTTGNLMGFVGMGGTDIAVHSRFVECSQGMEEDYFLHYMLQQVLSINLFELEHHTSADRTFDFLLLLFPRFLNEALRQGVYKAYCSRDYNNANVRGMIDIHRQLRQNMPFNGRIAYHAREHSQDNNVTQLIRHTIEYIQGHPLGYSLLQGDAETRDSVACIRQLTPTYSLREREALIHRNLRSVQHPYFSAYRDLQLLCVQILRHDELKYGKNAREVYGILFDGAWLWEEYLAKLLLPFGFLHPQNRKRLGGICLTVRSSDIYQRYPDFYKEGNSTIVLDAKYKRELDRHDIHQLITYLYRLQGACGGFILPGYSVDKTEQLLGYGARLGYFYFDIPQGCTSQQEFSQRMKQCESQMLQQLTFFH